MNRITRAVLIVVSVTAVLLVSSEVKAAITPQGVVTAREWLNISGTTLDNLTNLSAFPNSPDNIDYAPRFEWPTGPVGDDAPPPGNVENNYGVQLIGYFIPSQTGTYRFAISADDNALVYLSTDSNPANKVRIAIEAGWNQVRSFSNQDFSRGRAEVDVGTLDQRWNNQSKPIQLTAGQAYYIEGQMKEGGGGDNFAVAYKTDGTWPVDGDLPIPGSELATIDKTSGPVSITMQPQSQAIQEGTPLYLSVVADGTPPYAYQWKKSGTVITDATNRTFWIAFTSGGDAGSYTVTVSGGQGAPVTSDPAVITVNTDTTKPTIVQVSGSGDSKHVTVIYSERIEEGSATNVANYTITGLGTIAVTGGRLLNETTVELATSLQTVESSYTLTANNVKDRASTPNTIAANTQVQFSSAQFQTGIAKWERWQDSNGSIDTLNIDTFVANLADPNFRGPDVTGVFSYLGSPRGVSDNYGARSFCYFVPPTTDDYVLFLACAEEGYLYLSTDSDPANKKLIAAQPAWSDMLQWIDPDTTENRSDKYSMSAWPTGNTIHLVQGTRYYVEAVFRAGGGGDGLEVTYQRSTQPDPANGTASKLTGNVIGSYVDPAILPPAIKTRPTSTNFNRGDTVTMSVVAESTRPMTYQWYQNKIAVPGATGATLILENADYRAVGDYYVRVSNVNGSVDTLPDDGCRVLMHGAFVIEAEDFNFNRGQSMPVASVMPYTGNAYLNITSQVLDVDFFNTADESGTSAVAYGRFLGSELAVVDIKGPSDPADYDRGDFMMTANYAIGWTDAGEWQNYTRNFPMGNYVIFAGVAYDQYAADSIDMFLSLVADPTRADGSRPGVEGNQQGVTRLGSFKAGGTGAWSSNDLIPLRDDAGNIVKVPLSGNRTLRWSANKTDGDMDYLLLYLADHGDPFPPSIARTPTGATVTFGGILQSAPAVTGPYTDVPGATSPYPVTTTGTQQYYRLRW